MHPVLKTQEVKGLNLFLLISQVCLSGSLEKKVITLPKNNESVSKFSRYHYTALTLLICAGVALSVFLFIAVHKSKQRKMRLLSVQPAKCRVSVLAHHFLKSIEAIGSIADLYKPSQKHKRKVCHRVYYVEPHKGDAMASRFDLAANAARLEALNILRDTGQISAPEAGTLVQETAGQYGFLPFKPLCRNGLPADCADNCQQYLQGFGRGLSRTAHMLARAQSNHRSE